MTEGPVGVKGDSEANSGGFVVGGDGGRGISTATATIAVAASCSSSVCTFLVAPTFGPF